MEKGGREEGRRKQGGGRREGGGRSYFQYFFLSPVSSPIIFHIRCLCLMCFHQFLSSSFSLVILSINLESGPSLMLPKAFLTMVWNVPEAHDTREHQEVTGGQ